MGGMGGKHARLRNIERSAQATLLDSELITFCLLWTQIIFATGNIFCMFGGRSGSFLYEHFLKFSQSIFSSREFTSVLKPKTSKAKT